MDEDPQATDEYTQLVDQNGLVKLFANRARARILASLLYADEPLSVKQIAAGAGITQSTVHQAIDALEPFDVLDETTGEDGQSHYELAEDDPLVTATRSLAEAATNAFYDE
ncbi:winged helix-turn-helix domain-containing protein [Halalkalirubrum salinum]|uniref:winged helix-turn-helix domain-containing protein n=1 Tax=Halalkalirubrum salinum TaxID=2563889 RepID=UPI0010FB4C19|nr:winged helix-turn-helix domain-containing protein [Halalkalirubrum salinum]